MIRALRNRVLNRCTNKVEAETMAMKNPLHPGLSIRENCLDALGLSVTESAKMPGVVRRTLSPSEGRVEVSSALLRMASLFGFAFGVAAHDLAQEGRSVPMRFEESDP